MVLDKDSALISESVGVMAWVEAFERVTGVMRKRS